MGSDFGGQGRLEGIRTGHEHSNGEMLHSDLRRHRHHGARDSRAFALRFSPALVSPAEERLRWDGPLGKSCHAMLPARTSQPVLHGHFSKL